MYNVNIHFNMTFYYQVEYAPLWPVPDSAAYWWRRTAGQSQSSTCLCALSHLPKKRQKDNCRHFIRLCISRGFFATTHPFRAATFKMIHCGCANIGWMRWVNPPFVGLAWHDHRGTSWYSCFLALVVHFLCSHLFSCQRFLQMFPTNTVNTNSVFFIYEVKYCMIKP